MLYLYCLYQRQTIICISVTDTNWNADFCLYMKQIVLVGKMGKGKFALISNQDFKKINKYKWRLDFYGYVVGTDDLGFKFLHKIIKNQKGFHTDHINGDKLDNRRSNLRIATAQQNMFNIPKYKKRCSSIYKGVSWRSTQNQWGVNISIKKKQCYIGYFKKERWAAMARDIWAKEIQGEFAILNFKQIEGVKCKH